MLKDNIHLHWIFLDGCAQHDNQYLQHTDSTLSVPPNLSPLLYLLIYPLLYHPITVKPPLSLIISTTLSLFSSRVDNMVILSNELVLAFGWEAPLTWIKFDKNHLTHWIYEQPLDLIYDCSLSSTHILYFLSIPPLRLVGHTIILSILLLMKGKFDGNMSIVKNKGSVNLTVWVNPTKQER